MSKKKNKSGFSLIEVMVAILVLVVLVIGSAAVVSQTGGGLQAQAHSRDAMELVNEIMESAQSADYSSVAAGTNAFTRNGISYTVFTTVTEVTLTVETNSPLRKKVAINLSYDGRDISADFVLIPAFQIQ